jgi:hypothetical protein
MNPAIKNKGHIDERHFRAFSVIRGKNSGN